MMTTIAALMAVMSINAQNGYDTRHEIGISYGFECNSDIISSFGGALGNAMAGAQSRNESHIGTIMAEYFYHLSPSVGVGAMAGFGQHTEDSYLGDSKLGENTDTYFTFMPAVKFNWLRKRNFGMYSKLAAGITFSKFKYDSENGNDDSENNTEFNWQASLLGIEAGSTTLRAFGELGFGEQGMLVVGLRYKF